MEYSLLPSLPKSPGVYFFKNPKGSIIYVGKAKSLRDRVGSYFSVAQQLPKTTQMVNEASTLEFIEVESEIDALLLEANLIRKLSPRYNVDWKDGKAYPLIEITKEKIPQVHFARQESNPKSTYFGPYPTGSDLTSLLRFLRKIFPFISQNHPGNKPCLRSHLGLCPCPNVFISHSARIKYLRNLKNLKDFLSGKRESVQKRLKIEMQEASNRQDYEKANEIKNKLAQIAFVTQARILPWEYEVNPNLITDRRQEEIRELEKILNLPTISKIECYDISNISGKHATGGQVVFMDGQPEKSLYRRYKIKFKATPDDYTMLTEMVSRRLKSAVPLPELIVIDGGKGQLSSISSLLKSKNTTIIALAKRLETVFTNDGRELNLPDSSPALHLLQRIRDEAHRFSRKYHFLLRSKSMIG